VHDLHDIRSCTDAVREILRNADVLRDQRDRHSRCVASSSTRAEGAAFRSDISIRVGSVAAFIADASAAFEARFPAARIVCFGHVGDGNLHFNALLPIDVDATLLNPLMATMLYDLVARYDGSFSAEHGVGQAKRDELLRYKSHVEIDYMRRIKQVFDPLSLMNPGKIL